MQKHPNLRLVTNPTGTNNWQRQAKREAMPKFPAFREIEIAGKWNTDIRGYLSWVDPQRKYDLFFRVLPREEASLFYRFSPRYDCRIRAGDPLFMGELYSAYTREDFCVFTFKNESQLQNALRRISEGEDPMQMGSKRRPVKGSSLREIREHRKLSCAELSRVAVKAAPGMPGISGSSISLMERGLTGAPKTEVLALLADLLDVDISDISENN